MTETVKKNYNSVFKGDKTIEIGNEGFQTIHYIGESTRPYVANGSSIIVDEIMKAGTPILDPQGVTRGLKWVVDGTMNGLTGQWELVIDTENQLILYFFSCLTKEDIIYV